MRGDAGEPEVSGAQSRDDLTAVLVETAERLEMDVQPEERTNDPRQCDRPRGGVGELYFLQTLDGPPREDVEDALLVVREMWEDLGYAVADRAIGEARGVSALTTDGGAIYFLTGPGGSALAGESACGPPGQDDARGLPPEGRFAARS
ncbi:hypothetical protein [Actinotalea sp. C106]|uniref:hypothetical protein n=1 Tax=Actinotalea sp. C106 TaxID=2908644 RepID=UPI0020277DC5|nr:hypothetical protein [Actinotalea sp. C106]